MFGKHWLRELEVVHWDSGTVNMAQSTARLDILTSEYVHLCLYPENFCGTHGAAQ